MKKKVKVNLVKETKEDRLYRIRNQKFLGTQVIDSKPKYSRKEKHKKQFGDID